MQDMEFAENLLHITAVITYNSVSFLYEKFGYISVSALRRSAFARVPNNFLGDRNRMSKNGQLANSSISVSTKPFFSTISRQTPALSAIALEYRKSLENMFSGTSRPNFFPITGHISFHVKQAPLMALKAWPLFEDT